MNTTTSTKLLATDLIGKLYPVTASDADKQNEIIGVKSIKKAVSLENVAGFAITLSDEAESYMVVSFDQAHNIMTMNNFRAAPSLDNA